MDKDDRQKLIEEMDAYATSTGFAVSTVGRLAGNGGDFYKRLRDDSIRIWPETAQKQRDYMAANPPEKEKGAA